jgi:hypothetical protein
MGSGMDGGLPSETRGVEYGLDLYLFNLVCFRGEKNLFLNKEINSSRFRAVKYMLYVTVRSSFESLSARERNPIKLISSSTTRVLYFDVQK